MYKNADPEGAGPHNEIADAEPENEGVGHLDEIEVENSENERRGDEGKGVAEAAKALHHDAAKNHLLNEGGGYDHGDKVEYQREKALRNVVFGHCYADSEKPQRRLKVRRDVGRRDPDAEPDENSPDGHIGGGFSEGERNAQRNFDAEHCSSR